VVKQTVPDLKELFRQAAEIAQQVPEAMQAAAFNRAVDLLTGASTPAAPAASGAAGTTSSVASSRRSPKRQTANTPPASSNVEALMEQIDSTQHPGIRSSSTVLDRSLMVLQIARTEHKVDGLVPSDIARILTDKFRVSTTDVAVRMALGKVTNLVNRVQRGNAFVYRIMGPGEEYLAHLQEGNDGEPSAPVVRRKVQRRKGAEAPSPTTESGGVVASTPQRKAASKPGPRKGASGLGPKAAIVALVDGGFFAAPKTGPQVQEHLKKKRGYDLGTDQLRLAMLRLVRDGVLEREENAEGQYEYKRP
jgi:hypothetical protein